MRFFLGAFSIFLGICTNALIAESALYAQRHYSALVRERVLSHKQTIMNKTGHFLADAVMDAFRLHRYLFSVTTAQIVTAITPAYILARSVDEDVQYRFYDPQHHKNINQFPKKCHEVAKYGVGIPMIFLSSLMVWAPSDDIRMTARIFAIGLPFVHSGKDILKKIDTRACWRPWHEDFSNTKRSAGGFPSGHMANITFATALFGMRHGLKFAIPLGLFSTFVFADFINCNRHYLSQIIAGAGLGIIYAYAANKVIKQNLCKRWSVQPFVDQYYRSGVKVAYQY